TERPSTATRSYRPARLDRLSGPNPVQAQAVSSIAQRIVRPNIGKPLVLDRSIDDDDAGALPELVVARWDSGWGFPGTAVHSHAHRVGAGDDREGELPHPGAHGAEGDRLPVREIGRDLHALGVRRHDA